MIAEGRGCKMPCESCAVQFSVFKRKRVCCECERFYCSGCLRRGGGAMCAPCRVLSTRPLYRNTIANLKVRDLQCFLQRQNVSTRGCVEKDELVNLCVSHVNGTSYRRRGTRANGAFSSLKGLTNNINDFLNNAFDLRPPNPAPPASQAHTRNCFNTCHVHRAAGAASAGGPATHPPAERFTTTPGGEAEISVPVPEAGSHSSSPSAESARVDTADCFEIEDLDDSGWEFVARPPADPLPNDSDVLLSTTDTTGPRPAAPPAAPADTRPPPAAPQPAPRLPSHAGLHTLSDSPPSPPPRPSFSRDYLTPEGGTCAGRARAASELELRPAAEAGALSGSLRDEPVDRARSNPATPKHVTLEEMKSPSELESLNVKQLKELLSRNRVEYRGCLERADLLQRANMLWQDHATYKDEIDNLPIEECCKICMAAPLECVLLECGHIAACTACSKQLAECPICRQYVVRAVRFFRS